jgi:hypothetical protein
MTNRKIFLVFFVFVLVSGFVLQKIIIPMTPWHAGHGLLKGGDWCAFHEKAVHLADEIRASGWRAWELRYQGNSPISITAAFYALTGVYEPWVMLGLNGFLYGISAVVLFNLFLALSGQKRISLLALIPLLFPSTAMIWGQIHKDIWMLPGSFMVFAFWVMLAKQKPNWTSLIKAVLLMFGGSLFVWVARVYAVKIFLLAEIPVVIILLLFRLRERSLGKIFFMTLCLGLLSQSIFLKSSDNLRSFKEKGLTSQGVWQQSLLPPTLDRQFEKLSRSREEFRFQYPDAGSNLDADVGLFSVGSIIRHVPKALEIALFAPFPNMWFGRAKNMGGDFMRKVAALEMSVVYLALAGWLCLGFCWRSVKWWQVIPIWVFTLGVATAYALAVINIGTLYRMRYPFMVFWVGLGLMGWYLFLTKKKGSHIGRA